MTPAQAIAGAKKGDLLPVYVVTGEEGFFLDQVVAEIRKASLAGGVPAFNEDRFTAGEADADKVIAAARTVPMMAARRFVLVRGVERWDAGSSSSSEGEDATPAGAGAGDSPLDKLAAYAQAPVPSTCLVLLAARLDGRRKLAALAKKQGFLVTCDPLDRRALPEWIVQRVHDRGHAIEPDVADLLAEIAGPELAYVNDAIERLSLFVGGKNPITEQAVSECVARVRTADTWALVDAVAARDLASALRILADVYDPRDRGLPLLGALAWSVRQLLKVQVALEAGASTEEAGKRAGIFQPFRAREVAAKTKRFRPRELERWVLVLAETDVALKSSRRPADAVLEDMLTRLCRRSA
jgi:DNA polymerase-3 subunit delta